MSTQDEPIAKLARETADKISAEQDLGGLDLETYDVCVGYIEAALRAVAAQDAPYMQHKVDCELERLPLWQCPDCGRYSSWAHCQDCFKLGVTRRAPWVCTCGLDALRAHSPKP